MADVLIHFGSNVVQGWNSLTSFLDGASITNLDDKNGNQTGISMALQGRFNGMNNTGASSTNTDMNMPSGISSQNYFGNAFAEFSGILVVKNILHFTGLDKDKSYDFSFFGARGGVSDNRWTKFIVAGLESGADSINTSSNTDKLANVLKIFPRADGTLDVTVTAATNNGNGTGFYHISAMRIRLSD